MGGGVPPRLIRESGQIVKEVSASHGGVMLPPARRRASNADYNEELGVENSMQPDPKQPASIPLTSEERAVLTEILDNYLSDLRMEIADTDSMDFKNGLRVRKEVVGELLGKLKGG